MHTPLDHMVLASLIKLGSCFFSFMFHVLFPPWTLRVWYCVYSVRFQEILNYYNNSKVIAPHDSLTYLNILSVYQKKQIISRNFSDQVYLNELTGTQGYSLQRFLCGHFFNLG